MKKKTHGRILISLPKETIADLRRVRKVFHFPISQQIAKSLERDLKKHKAGGCL